MILMDVKKTTEPALNSVHVELIRKYYRLVREYRAYREGQSGGRDIETSPCICNLISFYIITSKIQS